VDNNSTVFGPKGLKHTLELGLGTKLGRKKRDNPNSMCREASSRLTIGGGTSESLKKKESEDKAKAWQAIAGW